MNNSMRAVVGERFACQGEATDDESAWWITGVPAIPRTDDAGGYAFVPLMRCHCV